jgi:H+/Cl- antiporter ClcA
MTVRTLPFWLLVGPLLALLLWPYQALSELGFQLQRLLWLHPQANRSAGAALVFVASALLIALAWGPLAAGRGGGVPPLLALDRAPQPVAAEAESRWLGQLGLACQLQRLPLMMLTHVGGLTVGVESPSVALGASVLLAIRGRWPGLRPLACLSPRLVAVIGGAAGLGAAFRSPLLAVTYGLEELGQCMGLPLVVPALLLAGSATLLATTMGQPARLPGLELGSLAPQLWGWAALLTLVGAAGGALLVRLTILAAAWTRRLLSRRRLAGSLLLAGLLTLVALLSGGLSLNDGSLSLAAALAGQDPGAPVTLLWRLLATVLSLAVGAPGGLMHDSMSLGALLIGPLQGVPAMDSTALAQLAAVAATALFASTNGTPLFCAAFVFTLQGDAALLPLLLAVSAVSAALGERWRGVSWNGHQAQVLLDQAPTLPSSANNPSP